MTETVEDLEYLEDLLDELYVEFEPFTEKPGEDIQADVDELMEFLGFIPGTLHCCKRSFPWLFGNLENPNWLGEVQKTPTRATTTPGVVQTDALEPFLFVNTILLEAHFAEPAKKSQWIYVIKAMVRDKIVYFPLPIAQMNENSKYLFKTLFRAAQTEEI